MFVLGKKNFCFRKLLKSHRTRGIGLLCTVRPVIWSIYIATSGDALWNSSQRDSRRRSPPLLYRTCNKCKVCNQNSQFHCPRPPEQDDGQRLSCFERSNEKFSKTSSFHHQPDDITQSAMVVFVCANR